MKKTMLFFALVVMAGATFAQKKKTTTSATINFDATTKLDAKPKGENKTVVASLNTKNGEIAFEAQIKNFSFENPMMQEHFNSPVWLNSDKFPTSTYKAKITNLSDVNFKKDGTYTANVEGALTLHGITKTVATTATIVVRGKAINTSSNLTLNLADYGINGPAIGAGKVTDPKVTVVANFK